MYDVNHSPKRCVLCCVSCFGSWKPQHSSTQPCSQKGESLLATRWASSDFVFIFLSGNAHLKGIGPPKFSAAAVCTIFFLSLPKKAAWVAMENASLKLKFMYPTLWTARSHQIITGCWPCLATYSLSAPPHCLDYATTAKGFPGKSSRLPFNKLLSQVWYQRINHLEKCQKYKISNNHVVIDTRPRVLKRLQILWEYYFSVYMHLRRNCTHSNKK